MQSRLMSVVALLVVAALSSAQAQGIHAAVDKGTVIRIHAHGSDTAIVGKLLFPVGPTSTDLTVCLHTWELCPPKKSDPTTQRVIPLTGIQSIDIRHNYSRPFGIVGFFLGAGVGYLTGHDFDQHGCTSSCHGNVIGTALGAALIGGIGAILGSSITRWVPEP